MRSLMLALTLALASVARADAPAPAAPVPAAREVTPIEVVVQGGRYEPSTATVKEGEPVRLRFVRKEWSGCTARVVFPTLDLTADLPTNEPVDLELPPLPAGETPFRCGMNMVHGTILVEAK